MAPSTLERRSLAWLDDHTREWVAEGLISDDQAGAIRHFEHLDELARVDDVRTLAPQRLTTVAEVAVYLGSVIAFAGGAAIIGPNWEALGLLGQVVLGLAIAAVGFVAGTWMVRLAEPGTMRLGSFLWAIGTGGVGLAVSVVMQEIDPSNEGWIPLVIGLPVLAIGAALWRNLDRPLQLLTGVVGLALIGAGLGSLVDVPVLVASPIIWAASFGFGLLAALQRVRPRLVALAVSSVGLMLASFMLGEESERLAAIVAVATAAGIVAYALVDRSWPLVAVGLVAFFLAITMAMQTVLHGMGARLVAVTGGLLVVAAVAVRAQRSARHGAG